MRTAIPIALQIVIDDVGWWCGRNGHEDNEPYRTGIDRDHVPGDYRAIAQLGRELNMRPQAAMILCEWDTTNRLRATPTCQWMGERWDNARWANAPMAEAADVLRSERDHIELTLHGVGHEYWHADGTFTRAEMFSLDGQMRPAQHVHAVLDHFAALLDEHNLGPFPRSYVPCAFCHRFAGGLCAILHDAGIRFMSTPYRTMHDADQAQHKQVSVDAGVINLDRGQDNQPWYNIDTHPTGEITPPIVGMHWPNILSIDPTRNGEVVDRWVRMLRPFDHRLGTMLGRDTASAWTQVVYHHFASLDAQGNDIRLDFAKVDALPPAAMGDAFVVKADAPPSAQWQSDGVTIDAVEYDAAGGYHRLELTRRPSRSAATLRWTAS